MLICRLGRSFWRLLLAFFPLWYLAPAVSAQTAALVQDTASSARFERLAKSAAAAREGGKPDKAIEDYRQALEIRPDWPEGWWYLGTLQYDGDQYSDAIPSFQQLARLAPELGSAWNLLGLCEFETKRYADSFKHLEKGQSLGSPDDPEIARVSQFHFAQLLIRNAQFEQASRLLAGTFGKNQVPEQAKPVLGLALLRVPLLPQELDPSKDALIHAVGEVAAVMLQGDTASALDKFPSLLKQFNDTPYLHFAYGLALASAGRLEEALAQQRAEALVSPQSGLPQIEISRLELRLNHAEEALRAAEKAVRLAPDSPATHEILGQSLSATGRRERAEEEFRAAKKFEPEAPRPESRIVSLYAPAAPTNTNRGSPDTPNHPSPSSISDFDKLTRQAAAFQAAGNVVAAIEAYQQALAVRPQWDEGRWNLAMLYFSAKRYPQGIAQLKNWLQRKPTDGTAWAVLGLCEFETKDYENARIHLQHGTELGLGGAPESVLAAKYKLAILDNRQGEFEKATQLLVAEPSSALLAAEIQIALGMALLRIPLFPDQLDSEKSVMARAAGEISALLYHSRYDEAFPKLVNLLREYPGTPSLHYVYGTALEALSEYDEAEVQMREELRISPQSALPHIGLASIALRRHRPADGLSSAQRAVELAPQSPEAHYVLGRIYLEQELGALAVSELETASRLAPESPEVHFNLAKAYAKASLPEKAAEQRAIFARLNALAERQRSLRGNQSYAGSHAESGFPAPALEPRK